MGIIGSFLVILISVGKKIFRKVIIDVHIFCETIFSIFSPKSIIFCLNLDEFPKKHKDLTSTSFKSLMVRNFKLSKVANVL
jgi:hypothetical protein